MAGEGASAPAEIRVVGVVGAGAMGAGIAQVAAAAGCSVLLFDVREGASTQAIERIAEQTLRLEARGKIDAHEGLRVRSGMRVCQTIEGLGVCDLVIEAIVEELDAKCALFAKLEKIVAETSILATNTSSLSITAIAAAMAHPERCAGMHFFNPAPRMPLVEIISGASTSRETADTLYSLAQLWDKVPVHARSTPGFIVNRVARPFYAEALRVLAEGGAEAGTLDTTLCDCGGFRMGPFALMDLIGNDVNYAVTRSVFDAFYGDTRFTPSPLQRELVEAGFLGQKTGRGFYTYVHGVAQEKPVTMPANPAPRDAVVYGDSALAIELKRRLVRSDVTVATEPAEFDGRLVACTDFVLYPCDGRSATSRAASLGVANLVLIDHVDDAASSASVAIAASGQGGQRAAEAASALLQIAGYSVSLLTDVPGMIVLRTICMLINEAADAVNQRVCSAEDLDLAMRKGVNYPRGPLEWANRLGLSFVVQTLDYLAEEYGETRYRVSPLLRRMALAAKQF